MKKFLMDFLFGLNVFTFVLVVLLGLVSFIYAIISPILVEKIFELVKIPWNLKSFCYLCVVSIIILVVSYFLRKRIG